MGRQTIILQFSTAQRGDGTINKRFRSIQIFDAKDLVRGVDVEEESEVRGKIKTGGLFQTMSPRQWGVCHTT